MFGELEQDLRACAGPRQNEPNLHLTCRIELERESETNRRASASTKSGAEPIEHRLQCKQQRFVRLGGPIELDRLFEHLRQRSRQKHRVVFAAAQPMDQESR